MSRAFRLQDGAALGVEQLGGKAANILRLSQLPSVHTPMKRTLSPPARLFGLQVGFISPCTTSCLVDTGPKINKEKE